MTRVLTLPWVSDIGAVWCGTERKARDAAEVLAAHLNLPLVELADLGENDRSFTGYLPREEFEVMADRIFADPAHSVRGWETALDAQRRIVPAIEHIRATEAPLDRDVAVIAHGAVGTLLLCCLRGNTISREHDQPSNNGGNFFAFDLKSRHLHHGWQPID